MFTLDTERLHLRKVLPDDIDHMVALDSDPEVMRYINGGTPVPRRVYEEGLMDRMTAWGPDDPVGFHSAFLDGRFVGWFHLRPSIAGEHLELGYRLAREVWGQGLATEGSRALVALAFDALDQPMVDACALPGNVASQRVMHKLGMRYHHDMAHPRSSDVVRLYRIHRAEWEARTQAG